MRRRLRHLALFLVLGAVINYALAMGIIWIGPQSEERWTEFMFGSASFVRLEPGGMTRIVWFPVEVPHDVYQSVGPPAWSRVHHHPRPFMTGAEWGALTGELLYEDVAAGWPLRSVRYHFDTLINPPAGDQLIIQSGIRLPPQQVSDLFPYQVTDPYSRFLHARAIPLRIIPLGFAINTVLFASLAAMVWFGPPAIRRFRRKRLIRRNICLKCGYSRAGLAPGAVCPECGTA